MKHAQVRVKFLLPSEGGRNSPLAPRAWGHYMPHLRVVDQGDLLGVKFVKGPNEAITPGVDYEFEVEFLYPGMNHDPLVPGVYFEVLEGPTKVGTGVVIQRHTEVNSKQYEFESMTVNERLSHFKLFDEFHRAVGTRRLQDVVSVLKKAKLTTEQAQETAETILANPRKYGF